MKQGRTLQDLAIELDRQKEAKRDFIVDTRQTVVVPVEDQETNATLLKMVLDVPVAVNG